MEEDLDGETFEYRPTTPFFMAVIIVMFGLILREIPTPVVHALMIVPPILVIVLLSCLVVINLVVHVVMDIRAHVLEFISSFYDELTENLTTP